MYMCNADVSNVLHFHVQKDNEDKDTQKTVDNEQSTNTASVNGISSPVPQQPSQQQQSPVTNQLPAKSEDPEDANNENNSPKRLYISNIPFRYRDSDLRALCSVCIHFIIFRLELCKTHRKLVG